MFTPEDIESLYQYMMWNDKEFESLTDGPNHRRLIKSLLAEKKSSGLVREALIAKYLGLNHNTKMHSTTNGVTTFDAVHPITGRCYEIKAEQHTTNNQDRKTQSGQLTGTGVFSTIVDDASFNKLKNANPMIAHGMFLDGRMLALVTFELSRSPAIDRIERYFRGSTKTEPRYSYQDWINYEGLRVEYISPKWPVNISQKYKKDLEAKFLIQQTVELDALLSQYFPVTSKNDPSEQMSTLYRSSAGQFEILIPQEIPPTSLSD